jgi:CubicO group peptidase (beta-lactamase class C family)
MRPLTLILTFTALQLFPTLPSPSDQLFARFGEYVDALRTQAGIPGVSAAIVGEKDILWERGFGQQDVARGLPAQPDTPYRLDGLTQLFTATLVLQCAEEGRLALSDVIGTYDADSPWAGATIAQALSHAHGAPDAQVFSYQLERLDPLKSAIRVCRGNSYRETMANLLERLAMMSSVPGPDVVTLVPPAEGVPTSEAAARYNDVLARMTTSYAVPSPGVAIATSPVAPTTLTPEGGLVSTVRDFAQFDLALRGGILLRPENVELAWTPAIGTGGQALPHGLGWFVQSYNGERIVWQFGMSDSGSSSLVVTVPAKRLTLVLLANSDGLVKLFPLTAGDVTVSPFATVFLRLFVS